MVLLLCSIAGDISGVFVNLYLDFRAFTIEGRMGRNYKKSPRCDWRKLFSRVTRARSISWLRAVVRSCAKRSENRRKAKEWDGITARR